MKVIVAGSRSIDSYEQVAKAIEDSNMEITEIVSGGARGVDSLGEQYAQKNNIALKVFPAKWEEFGKSAGYIRNQEMSDYADALIAVYDGKSKGTANMIYTAKTKGLEVVIHELPRESIYEDLF